MSRPYAEPPGTPVNPKGLLAPELTPTPAVVDGTGEPELDPTMTLLVGELPRSGVCDTSLEVLLSVGRSVVDLSFGVGVDFVEGRTSESGSGFGASVDTTSLLGLFSSGPTNETWRGGVNPSNFPSTVETSIAFSPLPCPSPAAMILVVSGLRKYHAQAPSNATCITKESIASTRNQGFPVSVVKSDHPTVGQNSVCLMVFEKKAQPHSAAVVARVVYSLRFG